MSRNLRGGWRRDARRSDQPRPMRGPVCSEPGVLELRARGHQVEPMAVGGVWLVDNVPVCSTMLLRVLREPELLEQQKCVEAEIGKLQTFAATPDPDPEAANIIEQIKAAKRDLETVPRKPIQAWRGCETRYFATQAEADAWLAEGDRPSAEPGA